MTTPNELRAIAEAATHGPWKDFIGTTTGKVVITLAKTAKSRTRIAALGGPDRDANARFIATFDPPTVLRLLADLEAAVLTRPAAVDADGVERAAADLAELAVAADFGGNDIAGLRNGIVADAAIQAFVDRVAALTRPQAVDGVGLRAALEHEFCGWQVDDPREAAGTILAVLARHTAQSRADGGDGL